MTSDTRHAIPQDPTAAGPVMVIGGAEDKLNERVILARFVKLAGASEGHVVVISTASSLGEEASELYREVLTRLGMGRVSSLRPLTRDEANDEHAAALLDDATGIYLTGGNQLRLSSVVGGTAVGSAILQAHARGAVVAGTSAGASAVTTHMVAFGASGSTPKHRMVQISAGLGLVKNVVVDQHFEQRTRLGRLLAVVAQSPSLIGLGLDEDTAAIISSEETLEVIGRGAVTIVDGWWDAVGPHGVAAAVLSAYRFAQQKATAGRLVLARSGHPYHQPEPDLSTLFTSEPDRPLPPYDAPDFTDALLRKVNRAATILANIDRFTKLRDAPEPRTVTGPRGLFRVVLSGFSIVRAEVNAYGLRPSDAAELAADARDALLAARPSFQLHGGDR